jgi:hypothetical protein
MAKCSRRPQPRPQRQWKCLGANILVAADFTFGSNWKAYILPVPGKNHEEEVELLFQCGSMLEEDLARFLFPEFDRFAYDR